MDKSRSSTRFLKTIAATKTQSTSLRKRGHGRNESQKRVRGAEQYGRLVLSSDWWKSATRHPHARAWVTWRGLEKMAASSEAE